MQVLNYKRCQNQTFIQNGVEVVKEATSVIRISDGACIPFDPQNSDYAEYLKWLSEGNQPLPPDEPTLSE